MRQLAIIAIITAFVAFAHPALAQRVAPAGIEKDSSTQERLWQIVGLHVGAPSIVSFSTGLAYKLGPHSPGSVFAEGELGFGSIRWGAGYLLFDDQVMGLGGMLKVAQLHAISGRGGAKAGVTYTGVEATLIEFLISARVGGYAGRDRDGVQRHLVTADVGIGF